VPVGKSLIGVRKVCATGLHETIPNCTNLAPASNAGRRNCWSVRSCKSVTSHSKSAGLRPLGVRLPLPAPSLALCFDGAASASLVSCRSGKLPTVVKL
jgi:hypothetical protein